MLAAAHLRLAGLPVPEVLDEMAVMLERVFEEKGVEIDWRAPDELAFRGERQDLQEILGNLMENACKWARSEVVVALEAQPGAWCLVVDDDGPGVAPARRAEARALLPRYVQGCRERGLVAEHAPRGSAGARNSGG